MQTLKNLTFIRKHIQITINISPQISVTSQFLANILWYAKIPSLARMFGFKLQVSPADQRFKKCILIHYLSIQQKY